MRIRVLAAERQTMLHRFQTDGAAILAVLDALAHRLREILLVSHVFFLSGNARVEKTQGGY